MTRVDQERCPRCDVLSLLMSTEVGRDPIFGNATHVQFKWDCPKCHNYFVNNVAFLEIRYMGE